MKSNNVDSGSRGTTVDAALQCQHTSINNLIKSPVVTTLFQLPSFSQTRWTHSQRNPHSASSLHVVQCGLSPTGGCCKFLSYCPLLFRRFWSPMSLPVSIPSSFAFHWSRWTKIHPHTMAIKYGGSIHTRAILVWSLSLSVSVSPIISIRSFFLQLWEGIWLAGGCSHSNTRLIRISVCCLWPVCWSAHRQWVWHLYHLAGLKLLR